MEGSEGNVIQFADLEIRRVVKDFSLCQHKRLLFSTKEQTVECKDCKANISPFSAFLSLVEQHQEAYASIRRERDKDISDAERLLLRATRLVDEAWRSRNLVPTCPHCYAGISPEDRFGGSAISKGMDSEQRRFREKKV